MDSIFDPPMHITISISYSTGARNLCDIYTALKLEGALCLRDMCNVSLLTPSAMQYVIVINSFAHVL